MEEFCRVAQKEFGSFCLTEKRDFLKINILGTDYTIKRQSKSENPKLENAYGLCESYSKEIVLDTFDEEKKDVIG